MKRMQRCVATGVAIIALLASDVSNGAWLTVSNYTDGIGYFSWSLTRGNDSLVWGVGTVSIQSYGVEQVYAPPGWTATNTDNYVSWTYTNGTWFIHDTPVVFAVESVFTNAASYTNNPGTDLFPKGTLTGKLFPLDHSGPGVDGNDEFTITGPGPMPGFSGFSISNAQLHFGVEEMLGRTCFLERSSSLLSNNWQAATNFTVETVNTNLTQPLTTNGAFYRLRFTR